MDLGLLYGYYFGQHDAACRVIARLKKERDEARLLLAQAERQMPMLATAAATANASALSNGKRGISLYASWFYSLIPSIFNSSFRI